MMGAGGLQLLIYRSGPERPRVPLNFVTPDDPDARIERPVALYGRDGDTIPNSAPSLRQLTDDRAESSLVSLVRSCLRGGSGRGWIGWVR